MIVGIDPGFASLGYAFYDDKRSEIVAAGVLSTVKGKRVLAREDNVRRYAELWNELNNLWFQGVSVAYVEGMSQPRDASASWKLALGWGVILGTCTARGIPVVQVPSMSAKKYMTNDAHAPKEKVIRAVKAHFPGLVWPRTSSIHEHMADAIAVLLTGVAKDD